MRKEGDLKFPNSARLFSFCKSVLEIKFGHTRIIDQDVGQILGFDPAECSHWKRGRKNVKSVDSVRAIARHLGIDERFVIDVASGVVTEQEALAEYRGLGGMEIAPEFIESIRKEWQRKRHNDWNADVESELRKFFVIDVPAVERVVEQIFEKIQFKEAPLFLPEISRMYPGLSLIEINPEGVALMGNPRAPLTKVLGPAHIEIHVGKEALARPSVRFQVAREMAKYFLPAMVSTRSDYFKEYEKSLHDVYCNLFAALLLVPGKLLREEMKKLDIKRDIIAQLAETFWVSRALMNRRLRDVLLRMS